MATAKEKHFNKIRNLDAYKHLSDDELRALVDKKWEESKKDILPHGLNIESLFIDAAEIKVAKDLEKQYLTDYNIETASDRELLRQLIYLEVFHKCRLQKLANEFQAEESGTPDKIISSIHDNLNQIIILKEKLGLTKDAKAASESDAFKAFQILKQKFKIWKQNNQASRTFACKHCGQLNILVIKPDVWEAQKHPFFKDRIFGNTRLIELFQKGVITKEDIRDILGVSDDYISWLIDKWPKAEFKND